MAYADQQTMSSNRIIAIIMVVLLHLLLGYALVTGLAFEAVKKVKERLNVVDVKEEEPPEEEAPPPEPEKVVPPPVVAPPPIVKTVAPPPTVQTVSTPPPPIVVVPTAAPPAPPPPPPPPAAPPKPATPKNNPGRWATPDDYPRRALSQDREGTTGFRVTIGTNGRVIDCQVTSSSGHADLDAATCKNVKRRARFRPATKDGQPVQGSYSSRVRWQIPK